MATLPVPDPSGAAIPWAIREGLLDTGRRAARLLGKYTDALALNADLVTSRRDRRAPDYDIARARFNDYGPLLLLGRTEEALQLLRECRQVFQDANDIKWLGNAVTALASIENARGRDDDAVRLQRDALRFSYLAGDVAAIAAGYHNLGLYLHLRQPAAALASHLTAALIWRLDGYWRRP